MNLHINRIHAHKLTFFQYQVFESLKNKKHLKECNLIIMYSKNNIKKHLIKKGRI